MIIDRNFTKYVVFAEDSLKTALEKISKNKSRIIFIVSERGILEGVLTDGDLRRWLVSVQNIDLDIPVLNVMNTSYKFASIDSDTDEIKKMLNNHLQSMPLLDSNHRMVAVAFLSSNQFNISGRVISEDSPAFLIAEIGNNHNGSLELAKKLIDQAVLSGADCAKFQMRELKKLYLNAGNNKDASSDLGAQYTLDLLNRFQLSDEEMFAAFDYCRIKGIIPMCTPWDHESLDKLKAYGLPAYKVASADFTNYELISAIAEIGKPIICSTGMANESEIREGIQLIQKLAVPFVLLHCNSTYPAPFKDVNLQYILHLKEISGSLVGYSGHERDINIPIAAVSLGAKVIEKHLTLDKTMEGNDHKVSLLPDEFKRMADGIRQIEKAMGTKGERFLSQGELMNRETLAKSLVAAQDISPGTKITETMIEIKSPGQGLQPNRKKDLIGRIISTEKKSGDYFFLSDLGEEQVKPRCYKFNRKWGIPVRYHDMEKMRKVSNMDFLEIHLSYKDMDLDFREYIQKPLDSGLVVHAPELFYGDHTLDLCAVDDRYHKRSMIEMQRVINLARQLSPYFIKEKKPCIVTNVGGFSKNGHFSIEKVEMLYARLEKSLLDLDMSGVEVIPQTMPPFPWHFGGQQFHNLFVDADSIVRFCKKNKMRVCLDASHSKLACNHRKESFSEFLKKVGPYTAHLHIADAKGVDGEGLQIGDGEVDWYEFFKLISKYAPNATFIPEIWQGHKNNGEGAWIALERLEKITSNSNEMMAA
jgi:N-acetylneuraminate synthase